jgi:hypothetical protein
MSIWLLEYFEAGSSTAYMRETLFGDEEKDAAVLRFLHLGGDEVLKISPGLAGFLDGGALETARDSNHE